MQLFGKKEHLKTQGKVSGSNAKPDWAALVDSCKKGDRRAQKAVFDHLSGKMFAVCLRYMADREAAEDILDSYSGEGSFEGWARKIFVNTALMSLRKNDVLRQTEDVEAAWNISADGPSAIENIGYNELMKMVASMPPGFRTVFNMYVIEGYSHKEIAECLGISEATSRSQLQRARTMLQNKIKKY